MRYNAYEVTLWQHVGGRSSVHWRIRDPNIDYYYHRVGGPAYVNYSPGDRVLAQTWDLEGREYASEAEYQKALEKWLE